MQNKVKGFKAMHPDMTCRGFQFEVGKTFKHHGRVIPCYSGFHFCQDIQYIWRYYDTDCRIFEVEASGFIVEDGNKTVTGTLTVIKEIDYLDYINHPEEWVRLVVVNKGIGLDILVNDPVDNVRRDVALQGYGLDVLINDPSWNVRRRVAQQGYGLDVLINDPHWAVRICVASNGYGLDVLINDEDPRVRMTAISRMKELENAERE